VSARASHQLMIMGKMPNLQGRSRHNPICFITSQVALKLQRSTNNPSVSASIVAGGFSCGEQQRISNRSAALRYREAHTTGQGRMMSSVRYRLEMAGGAPEISLTSGVSLCGEKVCGCRVGGGGVPNSDHRHQDEERGRNGPHSVAPHTRDVHEAHEEGQVPLQQGAVLPAEHDLEVTLQRKAQALGHRNPGASHRADVLEAVSADWNSPLCGSNPGPQILPEHSFSWGWLRGFFLARK